MKRILFAVATFLVLHHQANADIYEDYIRDYLKKHPERTNDSNANSSDPNCPNYNTGYSGCPIFDKNGKLVVFEGPGVDRKTAEEYTENFNKRR